MGSLQAGPGRRPSPPQRPRAQALSGRNAKVGVLVTQPEPAGEIGPHLREANGGAQFDAGAMAVAPAGVIAGWTEALQLMREGDVWELYVPPRLGYGAGGQAKIPPNAVLHFDVELVSVGRTDLLGRLATLAKALPFFK